MHHRILAASSALLAALALAEAGTASAAGIPEREADPVVLTGAQIPALVGSEPGRIVAFSRGGDGWEQVPAQVDERSIVDYRAVRQTTSFGAFSLLAYTDPATYAGADPDPLLDGDDEIAAMARDAGERAASGDTPGGVVASTRSEVQITDPLQADSDRYLYLFRADGNLDPSAGKRYVDYQFRLNSGDYKSTYDWNGIGDNGDGPPGNQESSTVTTPFYSQHLLARWVEDELHIKLRLGLGVKRPGRTRPGKGVSLKVKVSNASGLAAGKVRVCGEGRRKLVKVAGCKKLGSLADGRAKHVVLRVKLRRAAAGRKSVKVRLEASVGGRRTGSEAVRIRVVGH